VNPEQRLSIREAVDLIAQHGEKPISESALRARAKTRRLGVSRVNGRIYTNPLNLASAGLIPIGVVTASVVPKTINDDELHAWLGSSDTEASPSAPGPLERLLDDQPLADPPSELPLAPSSDVGANDAEGIDTDATDASHSSEAPVVFDDTLGAFICDDELRDDGPPAEAPEDSSSSADVQRSGLGCDTTDGTDTPAARTDGGVRFRDQLPGRGRRPTASRSARLTAVVRAFAVLAVLVVIVIPSGGTRDPARTSASVDVAAAAKLERGRQAAAMVAAEERGDFDRVMQLASFAGDSSAYDEARSGAAEALLNRARSAIRRDRIRTAKRYVLRAERQYGDPDPAGRRSVEERIRRVERAADRARAAKARHAKQSLAAARRAAPAPAVQQAATPSPQTTTPAPATSTPSGSGSGWVATPKPKSQTPSPSSSDSKSENRDPEFF